MVGIGRMITVDCQVGRSPSRLTVRCADGGTFTMRVTPSAPVTSDLGQVAGAREIEVDGWSPPANREFR